MLNNKAFTILELLIVISIVGIISALIVPLITHNGDLKKAEKNIEQGINPKMVDDLDVRKQMEKILESKRATETVVTPVEAVSINTIPIKEMESIIPPFDIQCEQRGTVITKCSMDITSDGKIYSIPIICEKTAFDKFKCNMF